MASRSSTHLPTTIEAGLHQLHRTSQSQPQQQPLMLSGNMSIPSSSSVKPLEPNQPSFTSAAEPVNSQPSPPAKKRKFSVCQEDLVASSSSEPTTNTTTSSVPIQESNNHERNEKEISTAFNKHLKLLPNTEVSPNQVTKNNVEPQQQLTDKMIIERLQSQYNELANERTKMREGIIMATFQQRIKEDEWKEKERQYTNAIEKLTSRIQSLELQLVSQPQHNCINPSTTTTPPPTMISSSSSSASSSLASRRHSTPPKLICAQPDVIIRPNPSNQDVFRRNSVIGLSNITKEEEGEIKLPKIQSLLTEGRNSSSFINQDLQQSPSKIHLPPASSLLVEDSSGLYMVDELKQLLQQREITIEQQKLTIQRMEEEIFALKKLATSPIPPTTTAAATVATSSRQNRPIRTGNKLGKRYDFPKEATVILKQWMIAHTSNPYPSKEEKDDLAHKTGLTVTQLNDWMTNYRRRNIRKHASASSAALPSSSSSVFHSPSSSSSSNA